MADKVNPYRRWLGLAQTQPDFFQLLGIERGERRPEAIRSAAEARLELLKSFQDEAGKPDRKQLSEEIKLAFKTLTQADKRDEYLRQSSSQASGLPPLALPVAVSLAKPSAPEQVPIAAPLAAVPLATPLKTLPSEAPADPLAAVAQLGSQEKKKYARRSKSWLVPALSLALFLGGPIVVLAIIWFNSNQDRPTANNQVVKSPEPKLTGEKAKGKSTPPTESPFKGILKEPTEPGPREESAEEGNDENIGPPDPKSQEMPQLGSAGASPEANSESPPPADPAILGSEYATPAVAEVIRGVWVDLSWRNEDVARRKVTSEKGLLVSPGESQQLNAMEEVIGHSEGFWKQVVSSCRMLKTGEIRFGDELAMFIESTDQFVVLKLKGILVRVQLPYLPKAIAIELAERGKIEDIPRWRLQKSAALMLYPAEAAKNEQTIRELLSQSARDGHDVTNLEWMLQRRLQDALAVARRESPDEQERDAANKKLNEKIPDKQLAQNNMAGRNVVIQQLQALVRVEQDPGVRFVALERARKQTVKKADLVLCRQILERQAAEFEVDLDRLWLEAVEEMTDHVQSPQQAELVCEALLAAHGYGWPNLESGAASENKLSPAEDLARKYELKMTLDRIHYLTGQK